MSETARSDGGATSRPFGVAGARAGRLARRAIALGALGATLGAPASGRAAPGGQPVVETAVLGLEAEGTNEVAARLLTGALRQQVLGSEDFALRGESPPLVVKAGEARCPLKRLRRPLREASDRVFDAPCLKRLGQLLGARRFFWGHLYDGGARPLVKLHLWREGEPDRVATLPYDEWARDRVAERLYRKLASPEKVGDVMLTSATLSEGELFVDGKGAGHFAGKVELTLLAGEHTFELRREGKVLEKARARVTARASGEARLEPAVVAPLPRPAPRPVRVRPEPNVNNARAVWPWVLGGVGVAGLVGAGAFYALYRGEQGELDDTCAPDKSCRGQQGAIDRSRLYSSLSLASIGVGVGAGVGAYVVWRSSARRETTGSWAAPRAWAGVAPLGLGGAAAFVRGEF